MTRKTVIMTANTVIRMVPAMNTASRFGSLTGRNQFFVAEEDDREAKVKQQIGNIKGPDEYFCQSICMTYLCPVQTEVCIGKAPVEKKTNSDPELHHLSWHGVILNNYSIKREQAESNNYTAFDKKKVGIYLIVSLEKCSINYAYYQCCRCNC
jgi:hypothetical protein